MTISFSKMHGLGNDFMVIDGVNQSLQLTPVQIRLWANRHTGIGFDQLLLLEKSSSPAYDFLYRIFNADGSEVTQCGNGARCVAKFVKLKQLSAKSSLVFQTKNGTLQTEFIDHDWVNVNMGVPCFLPDDIPFKPLHAAQENGQYVLSINQQSIHVTVLSMGNPHAVLVVNDVNTAPIQELGAALQANPHFPRQVNVGFMQVIDQHSISLRVFERGAGETQACGSGACAAVVAGIIRGLLSGTVQVNLLGGELQVSWQGADSPVFMAGPAEFVFEGKI